MTTIIQHQGVVYTDSMTMTSDAIGHVHISRTDLGPKFFLLPEKTALVTATGTINGEELLNHILAIGRLGLNQLIKGEPLSNLKQPDHTPLKSQMVGIGQVLFCTAEHILEIRAPEKIVDAFNIVVLTGYSPQRDTLIYGSAEANPNMAYLMVKLQSGVPCDVDAEILKFVDVDQVSGGDICKFELNQLKPFVPMEI